MTCVWEVTRTSLDVYEVILVEGFAGDGILLVVVAQVFQDEFLLEYLARFDR